MLWNMKCYEEPGILFSDQTAEYDEAPIAETEAILKPGLDEGRKALALLKKVDSDEPSIVCPVSKSVNEPFDELVEMINTLLESGEVFQAVSVADGARKGAHSHDPEVLLLAGSVFEYVQFYDIAADCLKKALKSLDGLKEAAVSIRLARALKRSGKVEDVYDMVKAHIDHEEMPPILRIEGLMLMAMSRREEGLELLDEVLDLGEEHLGDHRMIADALELNADLLADTEPAKAEQFYLAAGKMLITLKDPYFFGLNERFVVHYLKNKKFKESLNLSQEMFELLKQAEAPDIAHVPYFVFANYAHTQVGNKDQAEFAKKTAHEIDDVEATRIEGLLKEAIGA